MLLFTFPNDPTFADDPPPTPPPPFQPDRETPPGIPFQDPDGLWVMNGPFLSDRFQGSQTASGGPDEYGYSWDNTIPYAWIDATSGTDTGLSGSSEAVQVQLPFTFQYYWGMYDSLWISSSGFVSFADDGLDVWQGPYDDYPYPAPPNDVISAYWTPIEIVTSGPDRVYYSSGGEAPDRFFVIEWYQVMFGDETYTFEIILHENGDIVLQYETMIYTGSGYACGSAGIEDSTGTIGLTYIELCDQPPSPPSAVRFYRPAPTAKVKVTPINPSSFTTPGEVTSFQLDILNIGSLGTDIYDLNVGSPWGVELFAEDGITPLTDSDNDGIIDTGEVDENASVTITAKIQAPSSAVTGDDALTMITAISSLDTSVNDSASIRTAVPARFVQVYEDFEDGAMRISLLGPDRRQDRKITEDDYYGYLMVVAETSQGFVYAWSKGRCLNGPCDLWTYEIEYTLLDRNGDSVREVTKLVDHSDISISTNDDEMAIAISPDGHIGLLWERTLFRNYPNDFNQNLYFAILDASGEITYGPENLTNNSSWGDSDDLQVPDFFSEQIASTDDDRFLLAWDRWQRESTGLEDQIFYTVRGTNGTVVKEVTNLTVDDPGGTYNHTPALAALRGNRAFLSWSTNQWGDYMIYYVILNSDGDLVKSPTPLSESEGEGSFAFDNHDAVELSDGRILAAWRVAGCGRGDNASRVTFAILDTAFNRLGTPRCFVDDSMVGEQLNASVTADDFGHGIITWVGYFSRLYYALVDSNGTVLTDPMIFIFPIGPGPFGDFGLMESSENGYGNTTFSLMKAYLPIILK
jgi:hypothetical protein